jgi:hypothetical protein
MSSHLLKTEKKYIIYTVFFRKLMEKVEKVVEIRTFTVLDHLHLGGIKQLPQKHSQGGLRLVHPLNVKFIFQEIIVQSWITVSF